MTLFGAVALGHLHSAKMIGDCPIQRRRCRRVALARGARLGKPAAQSQSQ